MSSPILFCIYGFIFYELLYYDVTTAQTNNIHSWRFMSSDNTLSNWVYMKNKSQLLRMKHLIITINIQDNDT